MLKGGLFTAEPVDDTWRAGPARMRRGTEATWQCRAWPTQGVGGAQVERVARTRGRRSCESTRTPVRGTMWQGGLAIGGPTG